MRDKDSSEGEIINEKIMVISRRRGTGGTGAKREVPPVPPQDKTGGEDQHGVGV